MKTNNFAMLVLFALACLTASAFQPTQSSEAQMAEKAVKLKKFDAGVQTLGDNYEPKQQFKVGDNVFVRISLTNKSNKNRTYAKAILTDGDFSC